MSRVVYRDLIGIPFVIGGRPTNDIEGLDCYGLVQEMGARQGKKLPERQHSEDKNVVGLMMSMQMSEWKEVERKPYAVLLFKINGVASHVGIVLDDLRFLHTWGKAGGVCVERIALWERRIIGAYEYVG